MRSIVVAALRKSSGENFSNRPAGRKARWPQIRRAFMPGWILRRVIDAGARSRKSPDGQIVRNKKLSIKPAGWRRPPRTKLRATSAITLLTRVGRCSSKLSAPEYDWGKGSAHGYVTM